MDDVPSPDKFDVRYCTRITVVINESDTYSHDIFAMLAEGLRRQRHMERMRMKARVRKWTKQAIAERRAHPYSKRQLRALGIAA